MEPSGEDFKYLPDLKASEQSVGRIESAAQVKSAGIPVVDWSRPHKGISESSWAAGWQTAQFDIPPIFYRKQPEVKHILRDSIPVIDCIAPILPCVVQMNSRQLGNAGQVKYHQYRQIPAKCIPSSNRVAP
jgi:hypothetical protein